LSDLVRKRSVMIAGHATSVSLEEAFWDALKEIAQARGVSVAGLIAEIDAGRVGNLSSAIRVWVLERARQPGTGDVAEKREDENAH
jgi:predicted DNA-binding ribbon-helix-helix protein